MDTAVVIAVVIAVGVRWPGGTEGVAGWGITWPMRDAGQVLVTTLGPLAVDGRPVRGDRLGTVVRQLIDARGRAVSVAALVDAVWDGSPPEDATGAVHALVSRVRRLGLPVAGGAGGYFVPTDQVRVDAVEASTLVARARTRLSAGDPVGARRCADEARALFPAAPELVEPAQVRLFAEIVGVRAEAALAPDHSPDRSPDSSPGTGTGSDAGDGFPDRVEADLRRLVAASPPHEPSAALLVRLLAAHGRAAEGLAAIEALRTELAERYGSDPSPAVTRVQVALLRGELDAPAARPSGRPTPASNLPTAWRRPATSLVGRDRDVATVSGALADAPLVTIVATGGAGKTRLAAEVARGLVGAGRTVRVLELAGLRAADEVLPAVLAAFGGVEVVPLAERSTGTRDRLRVASQDFDGVLVLDNCEHLLEPVATVVADLLAVVPPEVAVLATSRAPLGLVGETVHRLSVLSDDDARRLLAARAGSGGALPQWDPERVRELCQRLDNLPLALELAAARLRHMPIDDVLAGLADRFALLDDALRGLPDRHASLWALVDWSRELLAEDERELLQRLAVIPAPFTAGCAAAVAGRPDVRAGLATLVEQSLLTFDEGDSGPPRWRMLETVREYGEVRLDRAGELARAGGPDGASGSDGAGGRTAAMAGLVSWARALAVTLAREFVGPGQVRALTRCGADLDNLMAALRWATGRADEPTAVDIALAVCHLGTVRGLHFEVLAWASDLLLPDDPLARRRSAIAHGRATGRPLPNADRLAWLCLLIAVNSGVLGRLPSRLQALARQAQRRLFAERAEEVSPRIAALADALFSFEASDPSKLSDTATRMIAHPDPLVHGLGLFARSIATENAGRIEESGLAAEQAYRQFEAAGDQWLMGLAALGVAQRLAARGQPGADEWLHRSEHHLVLIGAAGDAASVRVLLDGQRALDGDAEARERLARTAVDPRADPVDAAQAGLGLAQLAWQEARYDDVLDRLDAVARITASPPYVVPQARVVARSAAASLLLRVSDVRGRAAPADSAAVADPVPAATAGTTTATVARATDLLRLARVEALSTMDIPVLGSCVLAAAELAAHLDRPELARELAGLGARLGASVIYQFQDAPSDRLAAVLAAAPAPTGWQDGPISAVIERTRELLDDLLGPA